MRGTKIDRHEAGSVTTAEPSIWVWTVRGGLEHQSSQLVNNMQTQQPHKASRQPAGNTWLATSLLEQKKKQQQQQIRSGALPMPSAHFFWVKELAASRWPNREVRGNQEPGR